MDPRFEASTVQSKDSYRNMVTVDYIIHHKPHSAVFYGVTLFLGVFLWVGAAYSTDFASHVLPMVLYGAVLLAICILTAPWLEDFSVKRVSARILRSTIKNAKDLGSTASFGFFDDKLVLDTPTATAERKYSALSALCETRNYYLLFQGKDFCFTVAKSGLSGGTEDEFRTFLESKCGAKLRLFDL